VRTCFRSAPLLEIRIIRHAVPDILNSKIVFASPLIYTAMYHGNIETLPLLYNYLALGVKIWIRKNALSLENKKGIQSKILQAKLS
jgi:hypothetical protein